MSCTEYVKGYVKPTGEEVSKEDLYSEFEEWFAAHLGYPVNLLKSLRQPDTFDYESAKGNPLYTAFSAWKASRGIGK